MSFYILVEPESADSGRKYMLSIINMIETNKFFQSCSNKYFAGLFLQCIFCIVLFGIGVIDSFVK